MKTSLLAFFISMFLTISAVATTWYFIPYSTWPQAPGISPHAITHNCGALCATFTGSCDISTTNWDKTNHVLVCPSPTPTPTPAPSASP